MKPSVDTSLPLASRFIRSLLLRHKVAVMRHVTSVADILGFTYTQVHRRMNGSVAWEIEEIQRVGEHFGETLDEVFAGGKGEPFIAGWFALDGERLRCELFLGDFVAEPARNALVATWDGAHWIAALAVNAPHGRKRVVERLQIRRDAAARRVAILDDNEDEARTLAEFLVAQGCEADAFTTMEALVGKMTLRRYDAYVLDWIVSDRSVIELVAMLRSENSATPIAILSGRLADGDIERDVAEALATYRLLFFEKPTRPALVASQLLHAFANG